MGCEMADSAKTAYDVAVKLTDQVSRTIWSQFTALLATNAFLVAVSGFIGGQPAFKEIALRGLPFLGLLICWLWYLMTVRSYDYYKYYFACANELEGIAFGEEVQTIRRGKHFAGGNGVVVDGEPHRLRWTSRLFRAEWMTIVVISVFAFIYGYLLLAR